jgi:hypothetical protein
MDKLIQIVRGLISFILTLFEGINEMVKYLWLFCQAAHPDAKTRSNDFTILIIFVDCLPLDKFCQDA